MIAYTKTEQGKTQDYLMLLNFERGASDGRDADYLAVADARGRRLAGRARLAPGETTWTFTPAAPWRAGKHTLVVRDTLEDPAGNRMGSRFETSIDSPSAPPADAAIPFVVQANP